MTDAPTLPDGCPLRDPSVRTYTVRDEAVLAGGTANTLLALNATALAVWACCDGTRSVGQITAHLARTYGATPQDISADVCAILSNFSDQRLVHMHRPGVPTNGVLTDDEAPVTFYVTFGGQYVEAYINAPELVARFKRFSSALHGPGDGAPLGRIEVHAEDDTYRLQSSWGSKSTADLDKPGHAITWLKRRFVRRFVRARPDLLWFHAGAVAWGGEAVMCVGQGGSGKSTLLTALYKEGWSYFSDDVLPYDPARGCVLPFPLTPVYREGGVRIMNRVELRQLEKKRTPLDPERVASSATPVRLLIFPRFEPDHPAGANACSAAAAIVKLSQHCFNKDGYCGDLVDAFRGLVERASPYDVEHNAARPSLEEIRPLLPGAHATHVATP